MNFPHTFITSKSKISSRIKHQQGFGISEVVIATSAGIILIGASTLAMRSTGSLINKMDVKAGLQQNTSSGKRLMRSEIERSLHLLIESEAPPPKNLYHTYIHNEDYKNSLQQCKDRAEQMGQVFNPVFGIKMAELNQPVYYGLSLSSNGQGYAIKRCGASMHLDGRYQENKRPSISMMIDDIGIVRCGSDQPDCVIDPLKKKTPLKKIAATISFSFKNDKTPERFTREPAVRLMTDANRKFNSLYRSHIRQRQNQNKLPKG